jgi:hypothetical protein
MKRLPLSVYFVASDDLQRVKIGKTRDLDGRVCDLRRSGPWPLLLVADVAGYTVIESVLHTRFATSRIHGEWFVTSPELEAVIADIQRVGRAWSRENYPLHLQADGIKFWGRRELEIDRFETASWDAMQALRQDGFKIQRHSTKARK